MKELLIAIFAIAYSLGLAFIFSACMLSSQLSRAEEAAQEAQND